MSFPQTSLIPSTLSLVNFFISNFPNNLGWYPNWYLGTPFHYLIGPVIPLVLMIFKFLGLNLSYGFFLLIIISLFITSLGNFVLVGKLKGDKAAQIGSLIFFLLLPVASLLLTVQNGLNLISFSLNPWIFICFLQILQKNSLKNDLILYILISFSFLIDISSLLSLLIGFFCFTLLLRSQIDLEKKLLKTFLIIILSLSTASFWYGLKFWLILGSNPSFGGVPLFNLITSLGKFLVNLLPIILAFWITRLKTFSLRIKYEKLDNFSLKFGWLFFSSFLILTLIRFVSDPKFVLDWIGFGLQLQFGIAIILGNLISFKTINLLKIKLFLLGIVVISLIGWINFINLWSQTKNLDYQEEITNLLKKQIPSTDRVFLSGSSVFAINSKLNLMQVRGGFDSSSINPVWAMAAYQIREGADPELAAKWLQALGTNYILINDLSSKEYFHDFKSLDKFRGFELVDSTNGNFLFKVNDAFLARIASTEILNTKKLKTGDDLDNLSDYINQIKSVASYSLINPNQIAIKANLKPDELISLAISFDPNWQIIKGSGQIKADPLGNLAIQTADSQLVIKYQNNEFEFFLNLVIYLLLILAVIYYDKYCKLLLEALPRNLFGFDS
ncbi:hypothetical protein HY025_03285 [Candidatus Daviesbacteria bacterium]|nr:hypothetical protein [Candidatus Daviesbacteria bacterium]